MPPWLTSLPPELPILLAISLIVVVIPATLTIFIRISLYNYLQDLNKNILRLLTDKSSGQKSEIVQTLEKRFKKASNQLENVNTSALVDEMYSQELFPFLGFKLQCEQWEYFSRLLPNLLLAFGLVGTFLGITYNLYNMSLTLSQADADVTRIAAQIYPYLRGMGIAFVTSLIALFFSSFLTIVNLINNTTVAKYKFISSLEDYLDNIYKPTVEGDTRLDKAVEKMVAQQKEFLSRFHENVVAIFEQTLGKATKEILAGHAETNNLARQVYENFKEAAGTISSSAGTFRDASLVMGEQTAMSKEILADMILFSNNIKEAAATLERSNFSEKLEQTVINLSQSTASLAQTQATFGNSVTSLVNSVEQVSSSHRRVLALSESTYEKLDQHSTHLEQASQVFLEASQAIKQSEFIEQISSLAQNTREIIPLGDKIEQAQSNINLLCKIIIKNIESVQKVDQSLSKNQEGFSQIKEVLLEGNTTNNNQVQVINKKFDQLIIRVDTIANDKFNHVNQKIDSLHKVGEKINDVLFSTEAGKSTQFQAINKKFDQLIIRVDTIANDKFNQVNQKIDSLQKVGEKIRDIATSTESSNSIQVQAISKKFDQLNTKVETISTLAQKATNKR